MPGHALRRRDKLPRRNLRRRLGPGGTAAPERESLALLPSGPDAVRTLSSARDPTCQHLVRRPNPDEAVPRTAFGPAGADFGFREPLSPHLARPGAERVAARARARGGPGDARSNASRRRLRPRARRRSRSASRRCRSRDGRGGRSRPDCGRSLRRSPAPPSAGRCGPPARRRCGSRRRGSRRAPARPRAGTGCRGGRAEGRTSCACRRSTRRAGAAVARGPASSPGVSVAPARPTRSRRPSGQITARSPASPATRVRVPTGLSYVVEVR